jgi:hypothetical protein
VEFSVRRPSPLNIYLYVREENLGTARKFVQNYLIGSCVLPTTHAEREGAGGTFLRQRKEVPPAHVQRVKCCSTTNRSSNLLLRSPLLHLRRRAIQALALPSYLAIEYRLVILRRFMVYDAPASTGLYPPTLTLARQPLFFSASGATDRSFFSFWRAHPLIYM